MKQSISTTCDSRQHPTVAHGGMPADLSVSCGTVPDARADGITARARTAMSVASKTGLGNGFLAASGNDGSCARVEPVSSLLDVLRVAVQIEPDPVKAGLWCRRTRIAEFGDVTAVELVSLGRAQEVIGFLRAVRDGARDV